MLSLNNTADIVTQDFRQHFVLHGCIGLAPNRVSELSLNHAERAFDVRAEVIPLENLSRW